MESSTSSQEKLLAEAYASYSEAIFRHCYFRVADREAAKDLMQETFTKAWNHVLKGGRTDYMKAFLYTIANNLIIDRSRKKKESSLDALMEGGFNPGKDAEMTGKDPVAVTEVFNMLQEINPKYREAIIMRFIDDLSPQEIASVLGISPNNASVRINHGLAALRKKYNEHEIS